MNGNEVQNTLQHNTISDIGMDISFIKTEQECSDGNYPVMSSLTGDTRACSSASSVLNYVDMKQTQENISVAIIKSEVLELPEEFIIKEEEEASKGHSELKDIETVYLPTVYKSEELEYVESVAEKDDINKYDKEKSENTTIMDTELSQTSVKKHAKAETAPRQCTSNRSNFTNEKQTSGNRFESDVCGKNFLGGANFKKHESTHSEDKQFICDHCDKTFLYRSHFIRHERIHTGEKPYKCDECHKMFSTRDHITEHKRTHTGEKPYKCDQCGKMFSTRGHFTEHKRTHTGEKPFKCDECEKMFCRNSVLVRHKRMHTGEKPYKCDQCDKKFSQQDYLIVHKRTHSGEKSFKCDQCDKMFSQQGNFIVHKRTHTGEKPFKCDQCHKVFSRRSHLIRHKRIHTK